MKINWRGIAITLTTMFVIILTLIGICFVSVFIYCQGFVERSPFIADNNLKNQDEVYEFVTQNLRFQSDSLSTTQNFTDDYAIDCGEVLPRTESTRFDEIEFDSMIVCFIPAHKASFLGIRNFLTGWLNVCFFAPRIRIIFFFEDEILTDVYTEMLLSGI